MNNARSIRRVQKAIDRINSFKPWFERQMRFYQDPARFVWQMAASQSGKTQTAVPKVLRRILKQQQALREKHGRYVDRPYWIVVPNSKIAKPVKEKVNFYLPRRSGLIDRAAQGRSNAFWSLKDGTGMCFLKYGANIEYKSFDQGEGLVAASLGGLWVDECARCDGTDIWQNMFARLKETKGWCIGTSSPAARASFYRDIYKRYLNDPEHSWRKWTSYDSAQSPYSAVTLEEVERAKATMLAHSFAREYLAEWASAQGQIYPAFSHEENVVKELPYSTENTFLIGVDVGVNHPTAIEVVRFDGNEFVFTEECTLDSPTMPEIVKQLVTLYLKYKPEYVYYDYGGGGAFIATQWNQFWSEALAGKHGLACMKAAPQARRALTKAWKRVNDGIQIMAAGFAANTIKVADGCKNLITEIDEYVWKDPDKTDKDEPVKENDDHVDAARYIIATYAVQKLSSSRSKNIFGLAA